VRKSDTVARMGGDEFVALLPDLSDPHLAESLAAKIVTALSAPIPFAGRDLTVSVSAGVCTALSGDLDADTLLRNTDIAMYEAKAKGRNRFEIFKPEMVPPTRSNAQAESWRKLSSSASKPTLMETVQSCGRS
jgi:diguanylate cyclase (GGDEF)-like protein